MGGGGGGGLCCFIYTFRPEIASNKMQIKRLCKVLLNYSQSTRGYNHKYE